MHLLREKLLSSIFRCSRIFEKKNHHSKFHNGPFHMYFHISIGNNVVCYYTLCQRSFSKCGDHTKCTIRIRYDGLINHRHTTFHEFSFFFGTIFLQSCENESPLFLTHLDWATHASYKCPDKIRIHICRTRIKIVWNVNKLNPVETNFIHSTGNFLCSPVTRESPHPPGIFETVVR